MMNCKNSIEEPRIWVLIAVTVTISLALWKSPRAAYAAGWMQSASRGGAVSASASSAESLASGGRLMLRDGLQVQTLSGQPDGAAISKAGFAAAGWYPTAVPATAPSAAPWSLSRTPDAHWPFSCGCAFRNRAAPRSCRPPWSDKYVSLLPDETRTLTARWRSEDAPGANPAVAVDGWNVVRK